MCNELNKHELTKENVTKIVTDMINFTLCEYDSEDILNYKFIFTNLKDLLFCIVSVNNLPIMELDYTDGTVLLYQDTSNFSMLDISLITNCFNKMYRELTTNNLRANIIEAVKFVSIV